jgi:hypothetical protein
MKFSGYQVVGIIFSVAIISAILIWSTISKKKLLKTHELSSAKITNCSYGGRGNSGTITFNFDFYISRTEIGGSSSINSSELNFDDAKVFFLGKTFPVVYNPDNFNNNFLLIRPKDFERFHYSFPDSLRWVLKYIHIK